jgi:hypothetical protein
MAQKVLQIIKLHIPAGGASPAPPVGPALGGASINIMDPESVYIIYYKRVCYNSVRRSFNNPSNIGNY